jgi:hypothetical protein
MAQSAQCEGCNLDLLIDDIATSCAGDPMSWSR